MLNYCKGNLRRTNSTCDYGIEFVTRKAQRLLKQSNLSGPPFLPERLAPLQRIKRIIREDLGNLSGILLPVQDGFEIKINATHSPQRQNFSCAHEIAHTFFFEEEGKVVIERLKRGKGGSANWEEYLCDIAASELLMPLQTFRGYASRYNFGIHSLIPLSRIFNTSISPTALRLCDVNPIQCFVVYWERDELKELGDSKLRAAWLTWSRMRLSPKTGRFHFNPKLSGEFPSVLKAYSSDTPTYARQWSGVGNFRGNCRLCSQAFGIGSDRFVISLVFPECDN